MIVNTASRTMIARMSSQVVRQAVQAQKRRLAAPLVSVRPYSSLRDPPLMSDRAAASSGYNDYEQDYDEYALYGSPASGTCTDLVMYGSDETSSSMSSIADGGGDMISSLSSSSSSSSPSSTSSSPDFMTPIEERDMTTVSELDDIIHSSNLMAMDDCGIVAGEDYYTINPNPHTPTEYDLIMSSHGTHYNNRFMDIEISVGY